MPAHRAILSLRLGRKLRVVHVEIGLRSIVLLWQKELSEYEPEHLADRERSETEKLRALIADWTRASGIAAEFDCFDGDEWRVTRHDRGKASMVVLAAPHTQPVGHCETLRAVLLRTGHPVVMVQPECEGRLGRRLMVGSEDAPPLRRALAPFLCTDVDGIAEPLPRGNGLSRCRKSSRQSVGSRIDRARGAPSLAGKLSPPAVQFLAVAAQRVLLC